MGFLSKKKKKKWASDEIKKYESELKPVLGNSGMSNLESAVALIAENQSFEEALAYIEYTRGRINYYNNKKSDYLVEAKLADSVYKTYVTDGISRLEKVNGRFMASQNMKLDLLIEQNNRIIQLLEKIAGEKSSENFSQNSIISTKNTDFGTITDDNTYCPSCNSIVEKDSKFCTHCGEKME